MARLKQTDDRTLSLFDVPQAPAPIGGSLDYSAEQRFVLADAIEKSQLSRIDIASRMSELTGQHITKAQLDAWTAGSKTQWRFPFEYAAAFEVATDSTCLQELLGRKRGSRILVGEETLLAELGNLDQQEQKIKARKKALQVYLRKER